MATNTFEAYEIIDREPETKLFEGLLGFRNNVRILAIEDKEGRGKSALLRKLQHQCILARPQIPTCLVAFDQLVYPENLSFLVHIAEELATARGVSLRGLSAYRQSPTIERSVAEAIKKVDVSGDVHQNFEQADFRGSHDNQLIALQVNVNASPPLDHEQALLNDIQSLAIERPTVLLFDAFDQCPRDLARWIYDMFLDPLFFDPSRRTSKLVLVVTGRNLDYFRTNRKWPTEELREVAHLVQELSYWQREHVEECLRRYEVPTEMLPILAEKVYARYTVERELGKLVQMVNSMSNFFGDSRD